MKYKYDFISIDRTNTVKEILKSYNISCKIDNTAIELFDPFIWLDKEDYDKDFDLEKRAFDLIGLKIEFFLQERTATTIAEFKQ